MDTEFGKIDGDLTLSKSLVLFGMITGDITVVEGGQLTLHGMCCRSLILRKGSRVTLHGTVCGNVLNEAGVLDVYGTIIGALHTTGGQTSIKPGAVIDGKQVPK